MIPPVALVRITLRHYSGTRVRCADGFAGFDVSNGPASCQSTVVEKVEIASALTIEGGCFHNPPLVVRQGLTSRPTLKWQWQLQE